MSYTIWTVDPDQQKENERILEYIRENPAITIFELGEKMYYADSKIKRILQKLKETGTLTRVGSGRSGYWKIN